MQKNIRELPDVVKLAGNHNVDLIIAYHDVVYVPELKEESLYHNQALSDECFLRAKLIAEKLGIAMFMPGLFAQPIKYAPKGVYCGYPFSHLYIYHDGRVGPCCMDFPDRYVLGDINHVSIEEVWNSRPILKLRKSLNTHPTDTCKYCVSHGKMDIRDPRFFFKFKGSGEYLTLILGEIRE
jgi:radical SAM protein with 4Fe4S-binding SPASM domain